MERTSKKPAKSRKPKKPPVYELWLGCEDWDLKPEKVYSTTAVEEIHIWQRAIAKCEYDYQLTAKVNDRRVDIPTAKPWTMPSHDEAAEKYAELQKEEFQIYELRDSNGELCERDVVLFRLLAELLSLWVNTDPMGGYYVEKKDATTAKKPEPKFVSYSVWYVDKKTGEFSDESDRDCTLEHAKWLVEDHEEDDPYELKILRCEEFIVEEGGA